jgi:hypothetical protein
MGRKILNRKEMRADFDAAERRKAVGKDPATAEDEEVDETEDEDEDEEEEEEEESEKDEEDAEGDSGDEEEADEGDDSPKAPKKRKVAAKVAKPPKAKSRTRTPKITRMKVVWGVFNNSNQRVATFDYPKRKDADDLAAKLTSDKKATHFVQPVKEPMEEKKEKEKEKNPDKK